MNKFVTLYFLTRYSCCFNRTKEAIETPKSTNASLDLYDRVWLQY